MCQPASFVVTKKQVFWSLKHDNHHLIITENNLKEQDVRGEYTFVRVEIVPPNRDYALPPRKWVYQLDQDLRPKWYDEKEVERRCRVALKEWRKQKLCLPNQKKTIRGSHIICCGGTVEACDNSTVWAYGNSTVQIYVNKKRDITLSAHAVLIDRSSSKPKCYIGKF